ncbi:MAG: acetyl-CoA decarbonylase/synthase complex subunit delta [Clostridiales bacterium]|nr:acetyl-CoA decarbonylase/synthase complex subunit delta [Clostridiales bacterium]
MPFVPKKQAYNAKIHEVELGVGEKAVKLGGQNVLPFHTFDAEIANAPKIGVELTDLGMAEYTMPGEQAFYEGCQTVVDMAKRAETMEGASFLCLHFEGADPNGLNKSVEECVQLAKDVADAVTMPIVIMGCKNVEKDTELFNKCAEALAGKNILVLSARDENYKTVGASAGLAYNQKVGAESAVDINLAKQLNTVMTQLGVNPQSIIMNIGSAAAGYGYEYVASTLDRIRDAALKQSDAMLQMPIMTPVSSDTWGVKESVMAEADMPEWGNQEERGIEMEITTAAAVLAGGSDAVIMRHPSAIATIAKMIAALM